MTASDDQTAQVWEVGTGRALSAPLEHRGSVVSAAFSADGTKVVTASLDKTARIWEVAENSSLADWSREAQSCVTATEGAYPVLCTLARRKNLIKDVSLPTRSP